MSRLLHAALAATAAVTVATSLPARAATAPPGPGATCGLATVTNHAVHEDVQTGVLFGAALAVVDQATGEAGEGTLTCTVQVASEPHLDQANDTSFRVSVSGTGVLAVPPAFGSYVGYDDPVYVCTEFTPAGGPTLYWHARDPLEAPGGSWTTNRNAPCRLATQLDTGSLVEPCGEPCAALPSHTAVVVKPDVVI